MTDYISVDNFFKNLNERKISTLCTTRLNTKKDYISRPFSNLMLMSDLHIGSPDSDLELIQSVIEYAADNDIYTILGGDLAEVGTRSSVGTGVYSQWLSPDQQLNLLIKLFKPLSDKGLLISAILGNHEYRIKKETSIDLIALFCEMVGIPYLGRGGFNHLKVGNTSYIIFYNHGMTGCKKYHTKMAAIERSSTLIEGCDIYAWGHLHIRMSRPVIRRKVDKRNKTIHQRKTIIACTGHYMNYDRSYADDNMMDIGEKGSPIYKLYGDKKQISDPVWIDETYF